MHHASKWLGHAEWVQVSCFKSGNFLIPSCAASLLRSSDNMTDALQSEIDQAKRAATNYDKYQHGELQSIIYRSTRDAYFGKRSVSDFLQFMGALIKDEDGIFSQHNIDMRLHFVCALKSQDANLEGLAELNLEGPRKEKYETRKANLISMIQGALVYIPWNITSFRIIMTCLLGSIDSEHCRLQDASL